MSKSKIVIVIAIIVSLLGAIFAAETIVQHHRHNQPFAVTPAAPAKSYEQMKAIADSLDFRRAEIETLEDRLQGLRVQHAGQPVESWGQTDEEQEHGDSAESHKLKTTYNQLAASYNSEMKTSGARYTRKADIPEDQSHVLPARIDLYLDAPHPDAAAR